MVNICGTEWKIEEVFEVDDDKSDGECDFDQQTIRIKETLHPHRKAITLTHELLHVIFDYMGLVGEDEPIVSMLEHHIYDLIKKFPEGYK